MKTKDLQDDITESFEVSKLPPIGPDGSLGLEPQRSVPDPRPRLCEAGPCEHYHRLRVQVDAEAPRAMKLPFRLPVIPEGARAVDDGMLYRPPPSFHTQLHHTCYPTPGIEIDIGPEPIVECSRWRPGSPTAQIKQQELFLRSPAGIEYRKQVDAWEARQADQESAAASIQADIDSAMAEYEAAVAARTAQEEAEATLVREQTEAGRVQEAIAGHRAAYEAANPKRGDE